MENQNEIIKQCLQLGYSTGGSPELAELTAEANGVGAKYNKLVMRLTICSNEIIAAMDKMLFRPNNLQSFDVLIGSNTSADNFLPRLQPILKRAIEAWINNEPLSLFFVVKKTMRNPLSHSASERIIAKN